MGFEVRLDEDRLQAVDAHTYRQEGQLVTFYRLAAGRRVVDSWAVPVASFKTSSVVEVRMLDAEVEPIEGPWLHLSGEA
jgi:hypothetical protein